MTDTLLTFSPARQSLEHFHGGWKHHIDQRLHFQHLVCGLQKTL
jgi:hypothetical protein